MDDPSNTMVVAGSGRSGTTWLSNIITATMAPTVLELALSAQNRSRYASFGVD